MSRSRRLTLITRLLADERYSSQEELAEALGGNGVEVTQATLSRDLRSLGVSKRAGHDGSTWYELPSPAAETLDRGRQMIDLKVFVNETRLAQNLAVVKTPPGHASAVARAIDMLEFEGLVGSVAGDDTVLCILVNTPTARRFKRHLDKLADRSGGAH